MQGSKREQKNSYTKQHLISNKKIKIKDNLKRSLSDKTLVNSMSSDQLISDIRVLIDKLLSTVFRVEHNPGMVFRLSHHSHVLKLPLGPKLFDHFSVLRSYGSLSF